MKRLGSPSPSIAAASLAKHEPPVLQQFVSLIEGSQDVKQLVDLFDKDATVEYPTGVVKTPHEYYAALLPHLKGFKILNQHKLIDPSQPASTALYFTGTGERDGKAITTKAIDFIELTQDGKKIKKMVHFDQSPEVGKAKL